MDSIELAKQLDELNKIKKEKLDRAQQIYDDTMGKIEESINEYQEKMNSYLAKGDKWCQDHINEIKIELNRILAKIDTTKQTVEDWLEKQKTTVEDFITKQIDKAQKNFQDEQEEKQKKKAEAEKAILEEQAKINAKMQQM